MLLLISQVWNRPTCQRLRCNLSLTSEFITDLVLKRRDLVDDPAPRFVSSRVRVGWLIRQHPHHHYHVSKLKIVQY